MAGRIVLISDDTNFFDFVKLKLELRKSDELFSFTFDAVTEKIHLLKTSVIFIDAENSKEKTLDLLAILKGIPTIVFVYNEDENYKRKCFRAGAFDFMHLLISDSDFRSRMIPAFTVASLLEKNSYYRSILEDYNYISKENEIFFDYANIIDRELQTISLNVKKAIFLAISPNDKQKYLINSSVLEVVLLNNLRKNDIIMNYAPNKYFLFMFDIDLASAQKVWDKITSQLPEKIYAGLCVVSNQKREQLINEALNKLHTAINNDKNILEKSEPNENKNITSTFWDSNYSNFKMFRQEFVKKLEQVITPVFYQIQQKYSGALSGVVFEHGFGEGYGIFYIKGKHLNSSFRITSPGFSKINIDISCQKDSEDVDVKRITLEPEELEQGLLSDLLEQFVSEYKKGI